MSLQCPPAGIWHGGDYNPEQWPPATWDRTCAAHAGRPLQGGHGRRVRLGLAPARRRPLHLRLARQGVRKAHAGGRTFSWPRPSMARGPGCRALPRRVARRSRAASGGHHGAHELLSEFAQLSPPGGGPGRPPSPSATAALPALCCGTSRTNTAAPATANLRGGFRGWLQQRYASLDELNQRWWTAFWSHTYTDWNEIEPPYADGERLTGGLTLDYRRFQNDSMLACFKPERDAIRASRRTCRSRPT